MKLPIALEIYVILCSSALLVECAASSQPTDPNERVSTVTFQVTDQYGKTVDCKIESFAQHAHEFASRFKGLHATQIPYGFYEYVLKRTTASPPASLMGRVEISSPEKLVTVTLSRAQLTGLTADGAPLPGFTIRGRLTPPPATEPSSEPIWVRLRPIFQTRGQIDLLDVAVDVSGEFSIYEPLEGLYSMAVFRGGEVLHLQVVSFEENWQPAFFEVRLSEQSVTIIHVRHK